MIKSPLFNRTVKTNILIYPTNGTGRDAYIAYNNAGFWKQNIKPITKKEQFKRPIISVFRSLKHTPPIWTYYSDGSGRDSYIYYNNGGLKRSFSPLIHQTLEKIIREKKTETNRNLNQKVTLSKNEKLYFHRINQIQKDLVNRLYTKFKLQKLNIGGFRNNLNNNTLHKSSSQIIGRHPLEPLKNNLDFSNRTLNRNDMADFTIEENNKTSFSPKNLGAIKFKGDKEDPWYFKRNFVNNNFDIKFRRHPKVKVTLESNNLKVN